MVSVKELLGEEVFKGPLSSSSLFLSYVSSLKSRLGRHVDSDENKFRPFMIIFSGMKIKTEKNKAEC